MKVDTYVRTPTENDVNFIMSSWLRSYRETNRHINPVIFYNSQEALIFDLLKKARVYISCNPEHKSQIFGYIVFDQIRDLTIVHYVYVKHPFRRLGIGSELFYSINRTLDLPCIATHHTRIFPEISRAWDIVYNPYILIRGI